MGKALLPGRISAVIANGLYSSIIGGGSVGAESFAQYSVTENASFTGLATRITAGGSGTNTCRFRDAGVAGQNVVSYAGTGTAEDTTHTDTLTAGDLCCLEFTDTGTDPTYSWGRLNVELASGHGCFHGCVASGGVVYDLASTTSYIPINGILGVDGTTTIANAQWKNRGYTSVEAFQIRVTSNARANNSVFSVNINGTDVGTAITYTAAETGLKTVTSMGLSLADGDLICVSAALGSGVENLVVTIVGVTLKSTSNASEVAAGSIAAGVRAASAAADYFAPGSFSKSATESNQSIKVGFAARCKNLRLYVSANTYTGNATLKLMVNGVAQITLTITAAATGWLENTTDTFDIDDNDLVSLEMDEGTSGSISYHQMGLTFGEIPAAPGSIRGALALLGVGG